MAGVDRKPAEFPAITNKGMTKAVFRICISLAIGFCLSLIVSESVSGQVKDSTEDERTVEEILEDLNKTLPLARVGLESNITSPPADEIPTTATSYYQFAIFSQGFRFQRLEKCRLTVRNRNLSMVDFTTGYPSLADGNLQVFRGNLDNVVEFVGDLSIPLFRLKANKRPFRHTKKPEKAQLLGTWRTEFKQRTKFFLVPTIAGMRRFMEGRMYIDVSSPAYGDEAESMNGDELTFTFDKKEDAEEFYSLMSRAIELCKE